MSQKGFVSTDVCLEDGSLDGFAKAVMNDMMGKGYLKLKGISVNSISGYMWEFIDPEEERLKKRIAELEDTNSRLYRQITESYDRRTRRVGVE